MPNFRVWELFDGGTQIIKKETNLDFVTLTYSAEGQWLQLDIVIPNPEVCDSINIHNNKFTYAFSTQMHQNLQVKLNI